MGRFGFKSEPAAKNFILCAGDLRVTLLTARLLRVEKGAFCDEATQKVINRAFEMPEYSSEQKGTLLLIKTELACFELDVSSGRLVAATATGGKRVCDFEKRNLLGTARTLDMVNGSTKLEKGLMSRSGVSIMDDSEGLVVGQDGSISERTACLDIYCFAYGSDYRACLRDFYKLTGGVPLIPKYALGNWWSRYKAYTQAEYEALMDKFIEKKIPVSVATIDMDWHWVDVAKRFGNKARPAINGSISNIVYCLGLPGWTGYSWNTELFPDHRAMLKRLHEQNYKVTMNVHPASGVRFFEDCYADMCKALGKNPDKKEQIFFDCANLDYIKAYFDCIHHPLEEEGVDFWWVDWQQGTSSARKGLDPLWALNHYHTLDSARGEKRGLTLSRYSGPGSHRYPLGFSGDSFCTWKSLDFQPYFTINAANAGYSWWSHDIGGHQLGVQDDELYIRWLQFGVFSPINRLHSSNNEFMGKEPWKRSYAAERIVSDFMRLRHRLIPYLYSANYKTYTSGVPVCEPMYYSHDCEQAYRAKNQYMFGSKLLVCPITEPGDKKTNLASCEVWLPEGRWTDVFTGRIYSGGRSVSMNRDLGSIPVLAGEGSIIPLYANGETNDISLTQPLEINVWRGNGEFELYEDDGETKAFEQGAFAITKMTVCESGSALRFNIAAPEGDLSVLPAEREAYIVFRDLRGGDITVNGESVQSLECGQLCVKVKLTGEPIEIIVENTDTKTNPDCRQALIDLFTRVQGNNLRKGARYTKFLDHPERAKRLPKALRSAIEEIIS